MNAFIEISLILALAAVVSFFMQKLRLPLILGYLLTGILAGPAVFNLLHSIDTINIFSQFGITALLFVVGLTLNPNVIRDVGKISLITGVGQIIFTTIIGFIIVKFMGYSDITSLYVALALTLSSTIIVSKILTDRQDLNKLYGKIAIGFLLVQDIAATLALIYLSSASQNLNPSETISTIGFKIVTVVVLLALVTYLILPRLTRMFAKSQEFLFIFSIGWGLGLAGIFSRIGLSVEIGALAAGITLASSPYHYEISAKIKMLRDFFIVMFFILLGSKLLIPDLSHLIFPAILLSLFVLIGNPLIVMILLGLMRYTKKTSFYAGLTVAQISEFSFILIVLSIQAGHIPPATLPLVTLVGIITITLSSILMIYADQIYKILSPFLTIFERKNPINDRAPKEEYEAILIGCHRVGSDFLTTLKKMDLKFLVVDFDPAVIDNLIKQNIHTRYGDAHDNEFLDELNLEKAKIVICTLPDLEANQLILNKIRKTNTRSMVINTARTVEQANQLYEEGSSYVILPHFLGGNYAAMLVERVGTNQRKLAVERNSHIKHLEQRIIKD